jgi:RNA polymerase sigma factor (sigma-70 family)
MFDETSEEHVLIEKIDKDAEFEKMESALNELKDDQKNCITLFYLEEKSYQEISMVLSISIKAVKSNIQNGKRNLKNLMEAKP